MEEALVKTFWRLGHCLFDFPAPPTHTISFILWS